MMRKYTKLIFITLIISILCSCGEDEPKGLDRQILGDVINSYAEIVHANYADLQTLSIVLQSKVDGLVDQPSQDALAEAKEAWLAVREVYGQTEAFRFYGGPIDGEDGPEGQMNAWPLDESYIDYVEGDANGEGDNNDGSNIINSPEDFPLISKAVIASLNEAGSETNISAGFHAIEFLLWGQDKSTGAGGGERPYTDYVNGLEGTHENQDRRGAYLKEVTALLVDDINVLVDQWEEDGSYRSFFTSSSELENSLEKIVSGIGKLSKGELAGERMFVAWDLRSKEDEQSCFSDNTHRDIVNNAKGIRNVYLGKYKNINSTTIGSSGIHDLLSTVNNSLAEEIATMLNESVSACEAIQSPFDQEFLEEPGRTRIKTAIDKLRSQGDKLAEAAAALGFSFNPEDI